MSIMELRGDLANAEALVARLRLEITQAQALDVHDARVSKLALLAAKRVDGVNLRERREAHGMSLGELGECIGCTRQALARYETSGRGVGDDTIKAAWAALDVSR